MHSTAGRVTSGAWLIILAAIFDLLDGKVARLTGSTTEMGVQLDSFADFLSFGVAPGILLYSLGVCSFKNWSFVVPILFLLAGAFRLARYNLTADPHRKTDFRGLPIPLAASFVASYVILAEDLWEEVRYAQLFIPALILLSWLMISNVRYSAQPRFLSLKEFRWRALALCVPVAAILVKPRWFIFPTVAAYIFHGFVREIYWTVLGVSKEGG